jgi:hypothetical protein
VLNRNIVRALRENQYYNVKLKSVTLRTNTLPDAKNTGDCRLLRRNWRRVAVSTKHAKCTYATLAWVRCTEDACLVSRPIKLACPAINKCQWAKWNSIFCPFHIPYWKWSIAYSMMQWSPVQQQYLWDSRPSLSIAVPCHVAEIFCFVIAVFLHCSQLCSKGNDSRSSASSKLMSTYTINYYCTGIRFTFPFYCFIRTKI